MNQRTLAHEILYKTIRNESYSNLLMRKELDKLEPIQRGFVTNLVNGVLRKYEFLSYQIKKEISPNTTFKLQLILIMALYERFYLNEKDYVVNNEYVDLCDNKFDKSFINAILHKITSLTYTNIAYVKYCLPEWIYNLLSSQYDEETLLKIFEVFQTIPSVYYRLNKSKCSYDELKNLNINKIDEDIFTSEKTLINTPEYQSGCFYIQDYNCSTLYKHLDLEPNHTLLDVCSAPGSKLFNCLDVLDPKNCYSNDVNFKRLNLVKNMALKLGFSDINYLNYDATDLKNKLDLKFDRIMVDAPCSGLGVIGRKPDLKFHISSNDLDNLQNIQFNILMNIKDLLKDDGILLYSTCTLNKKENDRQIRKFLSYAPEFTLLEENTIVNDMGDCFYYAKLKRINYGVNL